MAVLVAYPLTREPRAGHRDSPFLLLAEICSRGPIAGPGNSQVAVDRGREDLHGAARTQDGSARECYVVPFFRVLNCQTQNYTVP